MANLTAFALASLLALAAGAAAAADFDKPRGKLGSVPSVSLRDSAGNPCLTAALPDLTISEFAVKRVSNTTVQYDITFKNVGQGCAGKFNVKLVDGAGEPVLLRDVGEAPPWLLLPGETFSITGQAERSQMWVYPGPEGYASHLGATANHGQVVREVAIANNSTNGKRLILWGSK